MANVVSQAPTRASGHHRLSINFLLAFATVAVIAAGVWGLLSALSQQAPPARTGETVGVPGGLLRVDKIIPEHIAPMQMDKFANAGMSGMSSMGMDMAPKGQQRFAVEVTLTSGENTSLSYSAKDFELTGEGLKTAELIRSQLSAGTIASGSAISGKLVFQVPEKARDLMLSFKDGEQRIALHMESSTTNKRHSDEHRQGE